MTRGHMHNQTGGDELIPRLPKSIASRVDTFTGRVWLLDRIHAWLKRPEERHCLLVGGVGTGKSMCAAWLAGAGPLPSDPEAAASLVLVRQHVKAAHFCVFGTGEADPRVWALQTSTQLRATIPEFDPVLRTSLQDLQPLIFDIQQRAGLIQAGGQIIGVQMQLGNMNGLKAFDLLVRSPLQALYSGGFTESVVLIVDALDEARQFDEDPNIVGILAHLEDLPVPVRVLATTRKDTPVLKLFRKAVTVNILTDAPPASNDLWSYAYTHPATAALPDGARRKLADNVTLAAAGQFLYAREFLDGLLPTQAIATDWDTFQFPRRLSGIYSQFLDRLVGTDESVWFNKYEPLLGVIAVAQGEGFTTNQLNSIVGSDVRQPLREVSQYLTGAGRAGPWRMEHKAMADFLLEVKGNADYHIEADEMHRRILAHYRRLYDDRWEQLDQYGIAYLLAHILGARAGRLPSRWMNLEQEERNYAVRNLLFHMVAADRVREIGTIIESALET
jgi:hypothetical protein